LVVLEITGTSDDLDMPLNVTHSPQDGCVQWDGAYFTSEILAKRTIGWGNKHTDSDLNGLIEAFFEQNLRIAAYNEATEALKQEREYHIDVQKTIIEGMRDLPSREVVEEKPAPEDANASQA